MSIPDFILLIIAIIGCCIGIAGYFSGRDKHISDDAEWKGIVNTKLDAINVNVSGVSKDVAEIKGTIGNHEKRIVRLEIKNGIEEHLP